MKAKMKEYDKSKKAYKSVKIFLRFSADSNSLFSILSLAFSNASGEKIIPKSGLNFLSNEKKQNKKFL